MNVISKALFETFRLMIYLRIEICKWLIVKVFIIFFINFRISVSFLYFEIASFPDE